MDISTGVDRLLSALRSSPGKMFPISSLAKDTGMTEKAVRKWVHALEAAGKVSVKYSLTNEYVSWTGGAVSASEQKAADENIAKAAEQQKIESAEISAMENENPANENENPSAEASDAPTAAEKMAARRRQYEELLRREMADEEKQGGQEVKEGETEEEQNEISAPSTSDRISNSDEEKRRKYEELLAEKKRLLDLLQKQEEKEGRKLPSSLLDNDDEDAETASASVVGGKLEGAESGDGSKAGDSDDDGRESSDVRDIVNAYEREFAEKNKNEEEEGGETGEEKEIAEVETEEESEDEGSRNIATNEKEGDEEEDENSVSDSEGGEMPADEEEKQTEGQNANEEIAIVPKAETKASFAPKFGKAGKLKNDEALGGFSGRLAAHMARIKAKAKEIERIKSEKKRLLHEVYAPLSARAQEDIEAIADKILEYENRLLALREHAAQLPQEMADVSERHEKMASLASEMQRLYDETGAMVEESLSAILQSREEATLKADQIRTEQYEQEGRIGALKSEFEKINSMQQDAESTLAAAKEALKRQSEQVIRAAERLKDAEDAKMQIENEMKSLNSELYKQKTVLADLDGHLGRMDSLAEWARENRRDYEKRMVALSEYVKKGESDYAAMREKAEGNFVRKYLKELRAVSESYEFELSQAKEAETNYEEEIIKAKSELEKLIAEAKRMSQMQEMQLDEAQSAQPRDEMRMLEAVSENAKQRQKIRTYIRDAISGEKPRNKMAAKSGRKAARSKGKKGRK